MKLLWLVRHGQSRQQTGEEGWVDPSLSELGAKQAKRLHEVLAGEYFDHIRISLLVAIESGAVVVC